MPSSAWPCAAATLPDIFQDLLIRRWRKIFVIKCPYHVQRSTLPRRTSDHVEKSNAPVPQQGQELYDNDEAVDTEKGKADDVSSQEFKMFLSE